MNDVERESIINETIERMLLRLPEVVGNLITNHVQNNKINKEFYAKYPEFKIHRDVVMAVIEKLDGDNPLTDYKDILEKAVPIIKNQIKTQKSLNIKPSEKLPDLDFNGVL